MDTGETLAIDPIDPELCLGTAKDRGWEVTRVLNTHEHGDHTGGNDAVIGATGAKLLGPANAGSRIANIDEGLREGDVVKIDTRTGEYVERVK